MVDEREQRMVAIDSRLYERVANRVHDSEIESVDEYVAFALEELLAQLEETDEDDEEEADKEVRERLRELGYLD